MASMTPDEFSTLFDNFKDRDITSILATTYQQH